MLQARLLDAHQLQNLLPADDLVILDCRFQLEAPAQGRKDWEAGHIPGALHADLEHDLSAPVLPGKTGRHPLPDAEALCAFFRRCGIKDDNPVVLYDDGPGAFAARAWWLLMWLGRTDSVWLLDGGWRAWRAAGLPMDSEIPSPASGSLSCKPQPGLLVSASQLQAGLAEHPLLLDARALPRFRGEVEPIDPVAGHIPGACCLPFTDNLAPDGRFLPVDILRQRFAGLPRQPDANSIAYCGSGVTACHNLFALMLAGYPLPRLYAGSWSEWITDPQHPVARGD